MFEEFKSIYVDLMTKRKQLREKVINEIIAGERLIDFGIVGCDYPHYQPWLSNDFPEDLKKQEYETMEKAIVQVTGKYVSSPCDFLEGKLKQDITTKENLNNKAINLGFDKETQKYYGYKDDVVTSFSMRLSDIIDIEKVLEEKKKKELIWEEKDKMRKSLILEIISNGVDKTGDGPDYYASVKLTDPITKESLKFQCRNIFDFGYIINPDYKIAEGMEKGGLKSGDFWEVFESGKGWYPVRKLTEFEKRCVAYLYEFPPISQNIRL